MAPRADTGAAEASLPSLPFSRKPTGFSVPAPGTDDCCVSVRANGISSGGERGERVCDLVPEPFTSECDERERGSAPTAPPVPTVALGLEAELELGCDGAALIARPPPPAFAGGRDVSALAALSSAAPGRRRPEGAAMDVTAVPGREGIEVKVGIRGGMGAGGGAKRPFLESKGRG